MTDAPVRLGAGEARTPFWARCSRCDHPWPIAYLPLPPIVVANITKGARCPSCGGSEIQVARQRGGKLLDRAGNVLVQP